jgi:prophage antirepressor-like protein
MTNSVIPFLFNSNEVRTIVKNDVVWFVANDIAKALEYQTTEKMTRILDEDEADTHIMGIRSENGVVQNREVTIINESGMYHAIFKSRKAAAKLFRRWVTEDVLPTIRKTGSYSAPEKKTKQVLIGGLTGDQQDAIKALVKARAEALPQDKRAKATITMWSAVKSKYGKTYKAIAPEEYGNVVSLIARLPLEGEFIPAIEAPSIPAGKMLVDQRAYQDMERMIQLHRERLTLLDKANSEMQHAYNLAKVVIEGHMNNAMQAVRTANTYLYDPIREAHTALRMSAA